MKIKKFIDFINESTFYKGKLNPIFWKNDQLDEDIRSKLVSIAEDFHKDLKVDVPIKDIHLTGSLANFNWNKYSDLDVHVMLDFSKINKDTDLVKKALDGERFQWNLRHPVNIKSHDVELYAQDIKEPHVASGLYSLKNGKWITKTNLKDPKIDEKDIDKKANGYISEIENAKAALDTADSSKAREILSRLKKIKTKISKSRRKGLADDGEFSIENLVFKKLRNEKWIEQLIELSSDAYSKIYSE